MQKSKFPHLVAFFVVTLCILATSTSAQVSINYPVNVRYNIIQSFSLNNGDNNEIRFIVNITDGDAVDFFIIHEHYYHNHYNITEYSVYQKRVADYYMGNYTLGGSNQYFAILRNVNTSQVTTLHLRIWSYIEPSGTELDLEPRYLALIIEAGILIIGSIVVLIVRDRALKVEKRFGYLDLDKYYELQRKLEKSGSDVFDDSSKVAEEFSDILTNFVNYGYVWRSLFAEFFIMVTGSAILTLIIGFDETYTYIAAFAVGFLIYYPFIVSWVETFIFKTTGEIQKRSSVSFRGVFFAMLGAIPILAIASVDFLIKIFSLIPAKHKLMENLKSTETEKLRIIQQEEEHM